MSLLLRRYCTLLLPELQASEDRHGAFLLRTWSSMSVLSIRYRYYCIASQIFGASRHLSETTRQNQGIGIMVQLVDRSRTPISDSGKATSGGSWMRTSRATAIKHYSSHLRSG